VEKDIGIAAIRFAVLHSIKDNTMVNNLKRKMRGKLRSMPGVPMMADQLFMLAERMDSDRDRVPDWRDCKPLNPKRHSLRLNKKQWERLKKLEIGVTSHINPLTQYPTDMVHLLSKEARKKYPKERATLLAVLKKNPHLIGYMEENPPDTLTYASKSGRDFGFLHFERYLDDMMNQTLKRDVSIFSPGYEELRTKQGYIDAATEFIKSNYPKEDWDRHIAKAKHNAERMGFMDEDEYLREKKRRYSIAHTMFHEMTHVKQSFENDPHRFTEEEEQFPEHDKRPVEIEADAVARAMIKKRIQEGNITPEMYDLIMSGDTELLNDVVKNPSQQTITPLGRQMLFKIKDER